MNRQKKVFLIITAILIIAAIAVAVSLLCTQKSGEYTVTFQDYDGTVLKNEKVEFKNSASAPSDPSRDGYRFVGWDKDFSVIMENVVVTAEYVSLTEVVLNVDTVTADQNTETVEVKVSVKDNPGILGMVFSVNYDETALKLVECQNGVALSALTFQEPSKLISGCHFVWYGAETGGVMDGEILILKFEITDKATSGTYPITIDWEERDVYDSNCDMLNITAISGAIIVD